MGDSFQAGALVSADVLALGVAAFGDGVIVTDAAGCIVFANESATLTTGYAIGELLGRNCRLLQGADTDPQTVADIRAAVTHGRRFEGKILNYRFDGTPFWNALNISPIRDADGAITHYISGQKDITAYMELQRKNVEMVDEITRQGETARMLLAVSESLGQRSSIREIAQTIATAIRHVCASDRSLVGLRDPISEEIVIIAHSGWPPHLIEQAEDFLAAPARDPRFSAVIRAGETALVHRDTDPWAEGLLNSFELTAFAAAPIFPGGQLRGIILADWCTDSAPTSLDTVLSERLSGLAGLAAVALDNADLLHRAQFSAEHDILTGLPNRALFEHTLTAALQTSDRAGTDLAVLYCDVDRFKRTNDSLGHGIGDTVLIEVARRLLSAVRDTDMVARTGGDEFVILLPGIASAEEGYVIADRIRDAFADPMHVAGRDVFVQLSVGVAFRTPGLPGGAGEEAADALLSAADADMYRRKAQKRGHTSCPTTTGQLRLDADLRGAVSRGEIRAFYQPQIDTATGRVVAVEALARWHHPARGLLEPAEFITLAEDNGLITDIGQEILDQACAAARRWNDTGHRLEVSVNVSPLQLLRPEFLHEVATTLERHRLPADRLTLEITESRLVDSPADTTRVLEALRAAGVGISIDDFGTGFSSLGQLHALPVTELKIDRSFVQDGPTGKTLVAAIIGMSHGLGLRVVAEGIETEPQLGLIRRDGCDRAQGFLLGKPRPVDDFGTWLHETNRPHARE